MAARSDCNLLITNNAQNWNAQQKYQTKYQTTTTTTCVAFGQQLIILLTLLLLLLLLLLIGSFILISQSTVNSFAEAPNCRCACRSKSSAIIIGIYILYTLYIWVFWHAVRQAFPRAQLASMWGRTGGEKRGSCDYCNCAHYLYSNCIMREIESEKGREKQTKLH